MSLEEKLFSNYILENIIINYCDFHHIETCLYLPRFSEINKFIKICGWFDN